jgi:heat shock protein HslJ
MKKIMLTVLTVLCLEFALNCSSVPVKNYRLQREWLMVSFKNYGKPNLIRNNAKIDLTSTIKHGIIKGTGFMGCNKIFFRSRFKANGKMKILEIKSTEKMCPDDKLEEDFSEIFKNITTYTIEGHFLILTDNRGNSMKFIAADWD